MLLHGARAAGTCGEIVGTAFEADLEEDGGDAKAIGSKHSNAAIRYGDRFLLKVYRRLEAGHSPELEAGRLLSKASQGLVPQFVGVIEYRNGRAEPSTLAVLQRFVPNEGTAWEQAVAEVARFYERVLASHSEPVLPPEPQGPLATHAAQDLPPALAETMSTYLSIARILGTRTAEMHIAFASSDDPAFAPEPFSSFGRRSVYQSFRNLIGRVVRELRIRRTEFSPHTLELAQLVIGREAAILERIAPLLQAGPGGLRIRIHGDYHLGQVLNTGKDFVLIDFDGDERTSLAERRRKRSAIRDLAAMVRSFRFAAHVARTEGVIREADRARLAPWDRLWSAWASAAFLRGYFERAKGATFLPETDEALAMLLDRHVLGRALHELQDWLGRGIEPVDVPLGDILRMLDSNP
jgi:maltose alpha-D-glucosyltransferase/alpha-amylase